MSTDFVRGICVGAVAGAAVELWMLCCDTSTKRRAYKAARDMGSAVEDAVEDISHSFH